MTQLPSTGDARAGAEPAISPIIMAARTRNPPVRLILASYETAYEPQRVHSCASLFPRAGTGRTQIGLSRLQRDVRCLFAVYIYCQSGMVPIATEFIPLNHTVKFPRRRKLATHAVQFVTLRGVEGVGAPGRALRSAISTCGKSQADAIRRGATAGPDPKRSSASPGCASGMRPNAVGRQCFHRLCLHQLAPVARQFAQFTQRLRRNEARSDQPGRPESIRII